MANSSTNFIKINNEYVKFYATTNSSLPEILKNTGALIVVQQNKEDENGDYIRSLYLANNFIAEGHGFSSADVRDYYLSYAEKDSSGVRYLTRILENLKGGIDENATNMKKYVLSNGGDITNTRIFAYIPNNIAGYDLSTKYLTNLLKPAEYEPIHIYDVCSYIEYDYYDSYQENEFVQTHHVAYATNINELDFDDRFATRDIIYDVPRGAEIKSAYISLRTVNYSCDGFSATELSNNSHVIPHADNTVFMSYLDTSALTNRHTYDTTSSESFRNNVCFKAHSYGTSVFKKYPWMPDGIDFYSHENAIEEYTTVLGYIKCNICDVIRYGNIEPSSNISITDIYGKEHSSIIYDIDNKYSYSVMTDFNDNEYVALSIPEHYDIINVYQRRKYNTNRISYYEYNITGDVYELTYDPNVYSSYMSILSKTTNGTMFLNCKNYVLENKTLTDDAIIVTLLKRDNEQINNSCTFDDYNLNLYTANKTSYFIQNSEYNSNHWFSPNELQYIQNII